MASTLRLLLAAILLLFTITTTTVAAVEDDELESMLNVLRARGYNLFSNAIATSDLIYDVLTGKSFTFFAPTDSSIFTLDMTNTASDYISTLRCHVIPFRVPFSDLRRLINSGSSLPTLAPNHLATVRVETGTSSSTTSSDDAITVDGVGVLFPDLFYSRNLAVHGLRGILNCTSDQQPQMAPPRSNFSSQINSQANLPDGDGFSSPAITESQEEPSTPHYSYHIEPPSSEDVDSAADEVKFSPQVSPAYDLWLEASTSPHFAPSSEPVPPAEFSESDDPMAFPIPPSATTDEIEDLGADHMVTTDSELDSLNENEVSFIDKDGRKTAVSDYIPVTSPEDMAGIKETGPKESQQSYENTFDCPVTGGFNHVSFPRGYVCTSSA